MYKLNKINEIYLGKNKDKYLVINDGNDNIVLNISKGIEEENLNTSITCILDIYKREEEYIEDLDLDIIGSVSIISNVDLINRYTKKNVSSPFLLCIEDVHNKKVYVDLLLNVVYSRKNHYILKKYANTKERVIFEVLKKKNIFYNLLLLKMCKKLQILVDVDEEDTI